VLLGGDGGHFTPHEMGLAGFTVQLKDDSGNVLATTTTDGQGRYTFDQQSGIGGTGNYTASLVLPSGYTQTSADPAPILISRGDVHVRGVDFTVSAHATHLEVIAPKTVQAGSSFDVLVEAEDAGNRPAAGYTGTGHFSSSDGSATLPADYTFTAADHGSHLFTATFATAGQQTLTATDTVSDSVRGSVSVRVGSRRLWGTPFVEVWGNGG
jgi:hypothetical protein